MSPPTTVRVLPRHRLEARALLYRSLPEGVLCDLPTKHAERMVAHLADVIARGEVACVRLRDNGWCITGTPLSRDSDDHPAA